MSVFLLFLSTGQFAQEDLAHPCTLSELDASHLVGSVYSKVISDLAVDVYKAPSAASDVVAQLDSGTQVYVVPDPRCDSQSVWWPIRFHNIVTNDERATGYVVENIGEFNQLQPIFPVFDMVNADTLITPNNLDQLEPVAEVTHDWPLDIVWSPDGAYLALNTWWAVWVYNIRQSNSIPLRLDRIAETPWRFGAIEFSSNSETLATVGIPNGDLHLRSLINDESRVVNTDVNDKERYSGAAAISSDLSMWATAHFGGSIRLWDVERGDILAVLEAHEVVSSLAFSPDGTKLISAGGKGGLTSHDIQDKTLRLWDTSTWQMLATFDLGNPLDAHEDPPPRIIFSPNGTVAAFRIVTADNSANNIGLLDVENLTYTTIPVGEGHYYAWDISYSSDGSILVASAYSVDTLERFVVFMDSTNGRILTIQPFENVIPRIAFSPEGTLLAIAHGDYPSFFPSVQIGLWGVS